MKRERLVILFSILLGLAVSVFDAVLDSFFFYEGSFLELAVLDVPKFEIYIRSMIMATFLVFGLLVSRMLATRRKVEEELLQSEGKYRTLVDEMNDGIFAVDDKGVITFANRALARIHGLEDPVELVGRNFMEFLPAGLRGEMEDEVRNTAETGDVAEVRELPIVREDGRTAFVEVKPAPVMEEGRITGTKGVVRDITGRKRAEEALRESEGKLKAMLDSIGDHMSMMDKDLNIIWANDVAKKLFGEGIIGRKCYEAYHGMKEPCEPNPCIALKAFQDGMIHTQDTDMVDREGKTRHFHCTANVALRDAEGRPTAVLEVSKDITGRKRAEEALRKSEAQLAEAQRIACIGSWEWDIVENRVTWSDELYRIFGLKPQEFGATYEAFLNFVHPDDRETLDRAVKEAMYEKKPYGLDNRIVRADGTVRSMHAQGEVIYDESGKPVLMRGTGQDVTERRKAEERLARYAEELKRSNRELEHFAYIASHDLQEPLRKISGFTELLASRYKGKLGPDADRFITHVVDGANRMRMLINDLLSYSRITTRGKEFSPVDLNSVLDRVLSDMELSVKESGASVEAGALPTVAADESQMGQVFQNLISNALKFRGGEQPRVQISARQEDGGWLFSVRDNGMGFEPEYSERVFLMFQRLHSRAEYPGTGIGLALCKKIIERHGGRIWAEPEPGKGATFHFTIPAGKETKS